MIEKGEEVMPENAGQMQAERRTNRGRWPRGTSGNPKGKAKGTRNRATMLGQELLDAQAPGLCARRSAWQLKATSRLCAFAWIASCQ
jgi:hypothetical protein